VAQARDFVATMPGQLDAPIDQASYVVNASKLRQQGQLSEQLQEALESRCVIEQAKGITAQQHSSTVDQAFGRMRRHARDNNASLRVVAEAIVAVGLQV
jgi:AmiR/NasT family two-component response regulator